MLNQAGYAVGKVQGEIGERTTDNGERTTNNRTCAMGAVAARAFASEALTSVL